MFGWRGKHTIRRRQVREQKARTTESLVTRFGRTFLTWPVLSGLVFVVAVAGISLLGESGPGYAVGQFVSQPIYAEVDFQVPDPDRTARDKEAARAATPSYYVPNARALTVDRIRAELLRLYQAAAGAETFEDYEKTVQELGWPADMAAYDRLRKLAAMPEERGSRQFQQWVDALPLEEEYVVTDLSREPRSPQSTTDYVVLEVPGPDGPVVAMHVPHNQLVRLRVESSVKGCALEVARRFPAFELRNIVEALVFKVFREQPTVVFNQERTTEKMREAEAGTPEALTTFEKGKPFIHGGVIGSEEFRLLQAHHLAFQAYLRQDSPEALRLRQVQLLQRAGLIALLVVLCAGLLAYVRLYQARIFEVRWRTIGFLAVVLGLCVAAKLLRMEWPHVPELILAPAVLVGAMLAIAYPQRFTLGAMWLIALLTAALVRADTSFLLTLIVALMLMVYELDEIRSRTKLIVAGAATAIVTMAVSAAAGFAQKHALALIGQHALWAGGSVMLAAFVASGVLPFIERMFRIATSLTLLEWRDPTRPLLQLLAREAPGTYNHSLVVGTLAESACEAIGANCLLAQVGGLYHDIGKIHKAEYFAENQDGRFSRHANLSPTLSLLIILGHVKDGIEMAREYKLPRVLHQFIEEHHGTTVVRYFHQVAIDRQPRIASGKHDRDVPEAEFRYPGPKPRTRESAVVMICDGVEGAIRTVPEPTVGRIESVVHQIITDRLNDGQFDDCDITLKEIRKVEESLVRTLCSIYHGRVAYPRARKPKEAAPIERRASV
jgi:hypothetical protein